MSEIKSSVDYERLHEFRLLVEGAPPLQAPAKDSHACALVIWNRLWTDLSYESELTHDPGRMTAAGARMFANSLRALGVGADSDFMELLINCRILRRDGEDFFCDRYARLNPTRTQERYIRGNRHSQISRAQENYTEQAQGQLFLLDPKSTRRKDGSAMEKVEQEGCLWLIYNIDGALLLRSRPIERFNEGLMADASEVMKRFPDRKELMPVFFWLSDNKDHANLPRSTEQILAHWDGVMGLRRKQEANAVINAK
jgi:hypothetical protein